MLGHSSAIFGRFEGNAFTRQSERASVEESMRICFQHVHSSSDCLHDAPRCSAARLVRMLVVCLFFSALPVHMSSRFLGELIFMHRRMVFDHFSNFFCINLIST